MNTLKKIKINGGHKNETFKLIDGDKSTFLKIKNYDNFNHGVDYKEISKFDFVPNLISEDKEKLIWEYIDSDDLQLNNYDLKDMAEILNKLHNSDLKLPSTNHKKRLVYYYNDLKNKTNKPKEIEEFFQTAIDIIDSFDKNTPLHNDPWMNNFIRSKKKIFLIDWEYASLGDKHFDLAFAIDGSYLSEEQEKIFLESYGEYDKLKLANAKILVNYLTLVWMHRFDELPFSDKPIIENLHK